MINLRLRKDKVTNNNGRRLVDLCRSLDLHIVNGRAGKDKTIGECTSDRKSTIDNAIASTELFPQLIDINVDTFDKYLSDKHSPICFEFDILCCILPKRKKV